MDRRCLVIVALHATLSWSVSVSGAAPPRSQATSERVTRRPDTQRTLTNSDPAIQHALTLIGQPINPVRVASPELIHLLYARTPGAGKPPRGLRAFRAGDRQDPFIYVDRRSVEYMRAAAGQTAFAVLALAGTLVHEQVHNTDGEEAATRVEADFVRSRLGQVPRREWDEASRYLGLLELRAEAFARAERRLAVERRRDRPLAGPR